MLTDNKRLPETSYKAEYPYNSVSVSRSGHEFHIDDTPGAERIRQAHKSGTYFEISSDGKKVELVVADEYHYIKGGLTLTIENNGDIKVAGNLRLVVQGDLHAEVHGDMNSVVYGDSTVATLGDSVQMIGGDSYTKVDGTMSAKVDGNLNVDAGRDAEITVGGDVALVAEGDIDMEGSSIRIDAKEGELTLKGKDVSIVKG